MSRMSPLSLPKLWRPPDLAKRFGTGVPSRYTTTRLRLRGSAKSDGVEANHALEAVVVNVAVTIPQIFYDLIARVMPGFFFLKGWEVIFGQEALAFENSDRNWADVTFSGIAYLAICYLVGWLLASPATVLEARRALKTEEDGFAETDPRQWNIYCKYDWIRMEHPATGFRIVKLRAEHRMMQSSLAGVIILLVSLVLFLLYRRLALGAELNLLFSLTRFLVLFAVMTALVVLIQKMKKQFERSIEQHFWLLRQAKAERDNDG